MTLNHTSVEPLRCGFRRAIAIGLATLAFALTLPCAASNEEPAKTVTIRREIPIGDGEIPSVSLEPMFRALSWQRPVQITHAGDGTDRLFVLEQRGEIFVLENRPDVEVRQEFLNIRDRVYIGHNEEGLLSLAFHPDYEDNGRFFVWYSASEPRRTKLSEFRVSTDDPNRADPDSEKVILEVDQPWGNHNGATVLFGPDGYLYVSIGDGGAANDPRNHGQNLGTLLGSIIRIDVDSSEGDVPYAIPSDNPFVDRSGARPEIWAYGLRNVWRMSFDRATGDLWAGDVGQNAWEMVCLIRKGGNYGWNIREGTHDFRPPREGEPADPIRDPMIEYSHRVGISITGGHVYRGSQYPAMEGVYFFADYGSGRIWGATYDREQDRVTALRDVVPTTRRVHVTSFGEDESGELYICAFDRLDRGPGAIYRIREN